MIWWVRRLPRGRAGCSVCSLTPASARRTAATAGSLRPRPPASVRTLACPIHSAPPCPAPTSTAPSRCATTAPGRNDEPSPSWGWVSNTLAGWPASSVRTPKGGRPDAPGDVLRVVLPADRERGLAQRWPEPAPHLVPEACQRHADVAGVDAHAVEHLAGAGERGRRHLLGVELADGDVGRHGELAPRPAVARVEVARRDRRLGPHHRQARRRLALEDRPRQRRRAAVAADAGVRDPRGPAFAD